MRSLMMILVAVSLMSFDPAQADHHTRKKSHSAAKKDKDKKETGASCKAPAVGACASCAITCRPGETATCGPGMVSADLCARPPSCACK